ncbi:MAG: hypothetical protein JWQ66_449 [Mucilaginibacter sp.]|nr:hypothetical protein [Mucilaginibacter sp.]
MYHFIKNNVETGTEHDKKNVLTFFHLQKLSGIFSINKSF